MYDRALDLRALIEHRSVFLFGPRQTGKSTLVRRTFPDAAVYWRSRSQLEVDFVVGDTVAIEAKAKSRVSARDYKGLLALAEEIPLRRKLVVCHEPRRRRDDHGVEIVPVRQFLSGLWADAIVE